MGVLITVYFRWCGVLWWRQWSVGLFWFGLVAIAVWVFGLHIVCAGFFCVSLRVGCVAWISVIDLIV